MSKFINPFVDFGFKYIFGREESKIFLIDFLNALLENEPGFSPIVDIKYRDKEIIRHTFVERGIIFDIHCETADGRLFTVEMQNSHQVFFQDRLIYYASRTVVEQGKSGKDWYYEYMPVYTVAFMNFELPHLKGRFRVDAGICDIATNELISDKLRFILLQLPNFDKRENESQCHTRLDKWIYNIVNMTSMERLTFTHEGNLFQHLEDVVSYASLSETDRRQYDADLKAYRDYYGTLKSASILGRAEGRAEGLAEGRAEGRAEGKTEERMALITSMYNQGLEISLIAKIVNSSEDEVKNILGIVL